MQFVEGESRNLSDPDREGRGRNIDDLKNGTFRFKLFVWKLLFLASSANKQYKCLQSHYGQVAKVRFASFTHPVL